ncbi:MAG: exosortase/archaeosortase family protein [Methylacidiphilales bacterium]|nr:exosortase/archaeosortase family protein [Candidatus Methylacidiphilales bacterium]
MTHVSRNLFAGGVPGLKGMLFAAAVILAPTLLLWHLHGQWNPNGEYAYAWVVPLLSAFLCKLRWDDRPLPSTPIESAAFPAIIFALLTLPALWLHEAAPERSICAWSYAIASIGISLSLISLAGGASWLRWFSFPFVFILTTVPWPHALELFVSNPLMRGTARATVEILCLAGIPSLQSGNLVRIETGILDIAEACSGVRSLQAMVMISLFLGELFRMKFVRRLLLLAIGLTATLVANVIRTVALAVIGFNQGMSAVDGYHDAAGLAVITFSLLSALVAAFMLRPAKTAAPIPDASWIGLTLPLKLCSALLLWLFTVEISVETWYRSHEPKWRGWSWSVQWPQHAEAFHFIEIPRRSLQVLMCDESHAATWREPDGSDWSLYWIRWNPGNPAAEAAKVHRPDVCLTAEGIVMEKDLGLNTVPFGRMQIPFHSYIFRSGEKIRHVFFCISEEWPGDPAIAWNPEFEAVDMIQRALKGRRHSGEQSLELAVSGYPSESAAQEAFKARLAQLMQIME